MSEYWKSTPKYWCKHCGVFVRDTKLERANHEATGKHQGAIKRSLRELHRGAEREEREKERVKRELERLNGVVSGSSAATSGTSAAGAGTKSGGAQRQAPAQAQQITEQERQRQLEQLAELGVNIPTALRGNLAMAGEWTVTSTRIIDDDDENKDADNKKAVGVKRERERTEEEKETEEALNGLFRAKKPRRWGIDSKRVTSGEEDKELEALLSGGIGPLKTKTEEAKQEGGDDEVVKKEDSVEGESGARVKKEESFDEGGEPIVKKEPDEQDEDTGLAALDAKSAGTEGAETGATERSDLDLNAVGGLFKKKKGKNLRQK